MFIVNQIELNKKILFYFIIFPISDFNQYDRKEKYKN